MAETEVFFAEEFVFYTQWGFGRSAECSISLGLWSLNGNWESEIRFVEINKNKAK